MTTLVGSRVGHYRVVDFLGKGGMGEVYVAFDETLERKVALKSLRLDHRPGLDARVRFLREARVLSQLAHPNICQIFDYLESDGVDLLVLELISGRNLTLALKQGMTDRQKLDVAEQICGVLVAAHEKGIAHRDLKPDNVMITEEGQVKVLDFGLSRLYHDETTVAIAPAAAEEAAPPAPAVPDAEKTLPAPEGSRPRPSTGSPESSSNALTVVGTVMGTLGYMSPEQARGEVVSVTSDLYSFGLLLQELFSGRAPYEKDLSTEELLKRARAGESLPPEGIDDDLANLIRRLKSMAPAARPSAVDTAERLARIRETPRRRARRLALFAAFVLLALVAAGMTWQAVRIEKEARRANREASTARQVSRFLVNLFEISDPGESRGSSVTARELLDKASREIESGLKEDPAVKGTLLYTMASVHAELGLYEQALALGEKGLAQLRAATPPDETDIARALVQNAVILRRLGRLEKAEPLYREALAALEKALGPVHPDVGTALDDLGVCEQEMARYSEAEGLHERALAIFERNPGPRSRETATALTNLANVYNAQGKYDRAEALQRRALAVQEALLGPDHPDVASSLNNLATLDFNLERYDEAEELFRRVLAILEKVEGKDHPDVSTALNNLANVAQARGDFATAEASFLRAVEVSRKALGPDHASVAAAQSNLATVYRDLGRYAEAEALQRRALETDRKAFGPDHPNVAFDLHRLSILLRETGRAAEAEPQQRRAVEVVEKAIGPDSSPLALLLMVLADIRRAEGSQPEAEATYRRALAISEKALGPGSGDATDLRLRLAALLLEGRRAGDAGPLLSEALEACSKAAARGDTTPYQLARHATALLLSGRSGEARPVAARLFATGYRRAPFVALCRASGIAPPA